MNDSLAVFLSALFGAAVGGVFTLAGSIIGANRNARNSSEQARQERTSVALKEIEVAISAAKHEVDTIIMMMSGAIGTNVLRVYPTSLWERYSHLIIDALDDVTVSHLKTGYAAVLVANSFAEYDLQKLSHGAGYVNKDYRFQVGVANSALNEAVTSMRPS